VITGGSRGIGLATAKRFVEEGAYVFITGVRQSEIDAAVKQIGKNVTGVQSDVSNLEDLDRLYETVKHQKGRIDVLFANAGIMESASLGSITESHFDKIRKGNGNTVYIQKPANSPKINLFRFRTDRMLILFIFLRSHVMHFVVL